MKKNNASTRDKGDDATTGNSGIRNSSNKRRTRNKKDGNDENRNSCE